MKQYDKYVIMTRKEREVLRNKAREVYSYKNAEKINLKKRLPFYIPTFNDFTKSGIPLIEMIPYYIFITEKLEDGRYMYEGNNKEFNQMRKELEERYNPRIVVVESEKEIEAAEEKIRRIEMGQE